MTRLFSLALWGTGIALAVLIALASYYSIQAGKYDISAVGNTSRGVMLYDAEGTQLGRVVSDSAHVVTRDQLPEFLVQALLAREDAAFYTHGGVAWKGIARATLRNLKDMSYTQGASTLTMQLAKNTYEIRAKSLNRKFLEIALTRRIEAHYSKDEILTAYLNVIYFGKGAYGIGAAAHRYFSRPVEELHPGQCAALVGLIRGPAIFNPLVDIDAARAERDDVLARMVACGFITEERAAQIRARSLEVREGSLSANDLDSRFQSARRHIEALLSDPILSTATLKAHAAFTPQAQSELDQLCHESISSLEAANPALANDLQCAGISIEPSSGKVRAIAGSRDFSSSSYNRTFDAKRPIGPLLEPFIQAIAIDENATPIINRPVQTGRLIRRKAFAEMLSRLGFAEPFPAGDDIFRGFQTITPLELAKALCTLANKGALPQHIVIEKISSASDTPLLVQSPSTRQLFSEQAASIGLEALRRRGSGQLAVFHRAKSPRDIWIVQLTDDLLTLVWLGCDSPKALVVPKDLVT